VNARADSFRPKRVLGLLLPKAGIRRNPNFVASFVASFVDEVDDNVDDNVDDEDGTATNRRLPNIEPQNFEGNAVYVRLTAGSPSSGHHQATRVVL
jgi:hypothetical protein